MNSIIKQTSTETQLYYCSVVLAVCWNLLCNMFEFSKKTFLCKEETQLSIKTFNFATPKIIIGTVYFGS